jgi:uncharacterized membrane protein
MLALILSYFSGILSLLIIDGVMIYFVIMPMFKKYIGTSLAESPNLVAAVLFYLFYIAILLILIVVPGAEGKMTGLQIFTKSAIFGFGAYMTYELTSMSVMKGWSWNMVVVDTLWGTLLTGIIGYIMYTIYKMFL